MDILERLASGKYRLIRDLASASGVSSELLGQMLEDLTQKGYLIKSPHIGRCSNCGACGKKVEEPNSSASECPMATWQLSDKAYAALEKRKK